MSATVVRNSAKGRGSEAVDKKGLEERDGGQVKIHAVVSLDSR